MEILREGHKYKLASAEGTAPQTIQFIEKQPVGNGELETVFDGTTNEEVLKMLIDRMIYLNEWVYDSYNSETIIHLQNALNAQHARTADRVARKVEGTTNY
jgi:hypothetical protein